jgi:hypothetical protein
MGISIAFRIASLASLGGLPLKGGAGRMRYLHTTQPNAGKTLMLHDFYGYNVV